MKENCDRLIVEGLMVTTGADGRPHFAPMGPLVDRELRAFTLRPFCTSTTFANLQRTGTAVFHLIDDVELLARAAIGRIETPPAVVQIAGSVNYRLVDCCRWFELRVATAEVEPPRATFHCEVLQSGSVHDWFGFNRAKHAVVEAAILATRIGILPAADIRAEMARLAIPVQKTAGEQERRAWELLQTHINERLGS
ncbi:DUF447 domain-containing protein [Anatilimnocola floriformis]|uniref:DUF447 domain-containing protein n=1 Tax=Anatilimnocola floriformis TaxID=2948575 RepID=UPI0020C2B7F9|nr:DUF447 domain-containing protein [Anatilimnocola floriformis]